ncbi:30S ribosomal protein S5 [candidate division Kazan bacterium]|uniref:Small ribosomal subunit protein uS5 n=1 Tax=candidate division Kazan bacterium TaxID=2202143 RepID=A0A420ZDT6_UNCK3|nr:MAG: 30S ribosomal protein S5 [candidate division Kazan bacterium]
MQRIGEKSKFRPGQHRREKKEEVKKEFSERVLEINRVTRVVKGGKRLRFRALVVIGDNKNRVAYGLGKATDVSTAVRKGVTDAKKDIKTIYLKSGTLPYHVEEVYKSARVLIKPAKAGTGLIAGGPVRVVLQLTGVKDAAAKMLGSKNKINNVIATINALSKIMDPEVVMKRRGISKSTKSQEKKS